MATWTNVPNTVLEPGDPIRSVDIIAIKENVIALSEGASGAPKILATALNTGTNERDWVLARTADASLAAVGTYAFIGRAGTAGQVNAGSTAAGSGLFYTGILATTSGSPGTGTWRAMGFLSNHPNDGTVFLRIS
jgi:hypothetical protein